jgi:hypothetical protein
MKKIICILIISWNEIQASVVNGQSLLIASIRWEEHNC